VKTEGVVCVYLYCGGVIFGLFFTRPFLRIFFNFCFLCFVWMLVVGKRVWFSFFFSFLFDEKLLLES